jgi:hypothetical protein
MAAKFVVSVHLSFRRFIAFVAEDEKHPHINARRNDETPAEAAFTV